MPRIAVIGAGAAGLCAAKHLVSRGCTVTIYEVGSRIGGLWVYENDNGLSPAYRSLHLNSENRVTAYRDFPFPDDAPLYPDHAQVAAYLEAYADRFALRPLIRFNARVTAVEPEDEGWRVGLADGSASRFDAVVVASGHQGTPKHPPFSKDFTGTYLHAHAYREPEPFRGKDVLVVGVGNSACDIAADICTVTASTTMAARSPVLFMPRMFLGVPTARVLARVEKPWMPWPLRRRIRELIARVAHGRMEQWGFVTPKTRTHPAGHHLLMAQFIWGRVAAKPGIATVSEREVTFTDGSTRRFDAMIAATGYDVDLPFLEPALSPMDGRHLALYRRVVPPGIRGLYFVGFFNVTGGGNIRMMDDQAEWVATLVAGEVDLPDRAAMEDDIRAEHARIAKLYPDSPRYGLELDPREYRAALAQERRRALKARARRAGAGGPVARAPGQSRPAH
ncbi:flavin-containing monooxygenase [Methylobacterium aquaticum]|uniref:Trimethylamine monooxygenase n=1 Tax=Methylobacterium aquaticum TaxID=270351 RepID=A0A0C6FAX5_9HYPH|nr:NAD(P)-binding domain-containing protein [Methylobacterium aquaticum]BAQ49896.1 predicted flavoprotein [Methylobacterium aquaticum]